MFFKKIVDKKKFKVKLKIIPKTNEEYLSVKYGCNRFIDCYRFLSSSLDSLVKTLVDNKHKTLKDLKKENVDNDEILIIVNEIKTLIKEDGYENDSTQDLKRDYPSKIEKLEESVFNYMGETILNF